MTIGNWARYEKLKEFLTRHDADEQYFKDLERIYKSQLHSEDVEAKLRSARDHLDDVISRII